MNERTLAILGECERAYAANQRLLDLIEKARAHVMTPEEEDAQAVSFAHGNVHMECGSVTREMVAEAVRMFREGKVQS